MLDFLESWKSKVPGNQLYLNAKELWRVLWKLKKKILKKQTNKHTIVHFHLKATDDWKYSRHHHNSFFSRLKHEMTQRRWGKKQNNWHNYCTYGCKDISPPPQPIIHVPSLPPTTQAPWGDNPWFGLDAGGNTPILHKDSNPRQRDGQQRIEKTDKQKGRVRGGGEKKKKIWGEACDDPHSLIYTPISMQVEWRE